MSGSALAPELLRSFLAVADTGSFSAAARTVNLTQSAVSLHVKRLEERLDRRLFARTSRSVRLTPEGGALVPYARRLLRLQEAAEAAVGRIGTRPTVRLGISDEQADAYLPHVLPAFARDFPEARVEIVCDLSNRLVAQLVEGALDLALAIRHLDDPPAAEVLAIEDLVWVAGPGLDLGAARPLPLAFNPEGCPFRARALEALTRRDRAWQVRYESQSPTGLNVAVAAGQALTVKAARSVPPGCFVPGPETALPALPPAVVDLHRAPTAITAAHEAFADLLAEAVRAEH
jgi:DNA-binding transcriptional LysR family regulator